MNDKPRPAQPPENPNSSPHPAADVEYSQLVFVLLAIFLGVFGAHRFYVGDKGKGIALLLMTIPGVVLIVPAVAAAVWSIVDAVRVRSIIAQAQLRDTA